MLLSVAILAAALVFALVSGAVLSSGYTRASAESLSRAARALAAAFPADGISNVDAARRFAEAAAEGGYRVTLILPDGVVLADSEADPRGMENHKERPEVASALSGRPSVSRRRSATVGEELVYAAAPIYINRGDASAPVRDVSGPIAGVLRLALHVPNFDRALASSRWTLALAALAFVVAAIAAAWAFSRMTSRPIAALARAARSYGSGLAASTTEGALALSAADPEEMQVLASTLDSMASEINARIAAAESQGRELEAILDAMSEAVLALDSGLAIRIVNPAARTLFGLEGDSTGKRLLEATRSSALQEVAASCLESGQNEEAEISLFFPSSSERVFRALAAPLKGDARGGSGGVVLVLGDITTLRRLERVRRDFVANVSHELRTPVQLVKGFAESLREGALEEPEQARRFVGIIERNAARMENLISDLLSLASLEREDGSRLKTELTSIESILEGARQAILPKAAGKGISVLVECDEELKAKAEAALLEQAVVNLIDNAVKYSPPDTTILVSAWGEEGFLLIEVRDQGFGIPASDLNRIFERFYRVDKARSRELGGTGLGLAIVKHIAIAHGGDVSVESWEGEGSTFRIRIPL
jgi:two-component system phosphate regulon sensor histidine kinase PhoR